MGWPRKKIFCMRIAMNHINVHTKFQVRSSMYMVEHQLWLHQNGPKYAISGLLSGLKSSRNEPNWSKTKFFDDRAHKSVGLVVGSRKGVGRRPAPLRLPTTSPTLLCAQVVEKLKKKEKMEYLTRKVMLFLAKIWFSILCKKMGPVALTVTELWAFFL